MTKAPLPTEGEGAIADVCFSGRQVPPTPSIMYPSENHHLCSISLQCDEIMQFLEVNTARGSALKKCSLPAPEESLHDTRMLTTALGTLFSEHAVCMRGIP